MPPFPIVLLHHPRHVPSRYCKSIRNLPSVEERPIRALAAMVEEVRMVVLVVGVWGAMRRVWEEAFL